MESGVALTDRDGSEPPSERENSRWKRLASVELVLFLHNAVSMMVYVAVQDLMLHKACSVNFGFSSNVCDDLSNNDSQEVAVQTMVSDFMVWRSYMETSIKVLSVPLLGWWGDQYGRRSPLVTSLGLLGVESASYLVNALFNSWPLEAIMIGSVFYGLSGGVQAVMMLAFSYMADRTSLEKRTMRIGLLEGFWYVGSPVGLAIGPVLLNAGGYEALFGVAVGVYTFIVIYVWATLTKYQQPQIEETDVGCSNCGVDKLTNAFYATIKPRPNGARYLILVLIVAMMFDSFVVWGESSVKYLFTQRALDWSYTQYSHWGSLSSLLTCVGSFVMVPVFTMWFPTHDLLIGLIGGLSRTLERVAYVCATSPSRSWLMYAGAALGTCSPLAPIAIRSHLSKLATKDVGQVYAVMAVAESLLPFMSSPAYLHTYSATVETYPGAFYFISVGSNVSLCVCFLYGYYLSGQNSRSQDP